MSDWVHLWHLCAPFSKNMTRSDEFGQCSNRRVSPSPDLVDLCFRRISRVCLDNSVTICVILFVWGFILFMIYDVPFNFYVVKIEFIIMIDDFDVCICVLARIQTWSFVLLPLSSLNIFHANKTVLSYAHEVTMSYHTNINIILIFVFFVSTLLCIRA